MAKIKIEDLEVNQEMDQEELKSVQGGSQFENYNQKSTQLFSILSTTLKKIREAQHSITRNIN